jgi:hypothetical protein
MLGPNLNHLRQTIAAITSDQRSVHQEALYRELELLIAIFPQDTQGDSLLRVNTALTDLTKMYSTKPYTPPNSGTCSCCGQKIEAH